MCLELNRLDKLAFLVIYKKKCNEDRHLLNILIILPNANV